jgi:hypothetical protein
MLISVFLVSFPLIRSIFTLALALAFALFRSLNSHTTGRGETTFKFEGNKASIQEIRETHTLGDRLVVKGHEVVDIAGTVGVVPDANTAAPEGFLGINVGLERVVIDAPVTVHSGLFASHGSRGETGLGLGFTLNWKTNVAGLPRLEINTGDGEPGMGDSEQGRGNESLWLLEP